MAERERYLGDGVYATFDGYHVWLDLRGQDSTTRIALDPEVMLRLFQFSADLLVDKQLAVDKAEVARMTEGERRECFEPDDPGE